MTREQIIEASIGIFSTYGIVETSIDSISIELGVSKKLLYDYFYNKNHLIQSCVEHVIEKEMFFFSGNGNLLDDMLYCYKVIVMFDRGCLTNIYKLHLDTSTTIEEKIDIYTLMCSSKVQQCKEDGYIRNDISSEFVSDLIKNFLSGLFFCKEWVAHSINKPVLYLVLLRGILTIKGQTYIDSQLSKVKQ